MAVIGMGMVWASYTLMFWGYTLVKGYKIGLAEIVVPGRWSGDWPPPVAPAGPGGSAQTEPKVAPGQHPGDMPWTYPSNPDNREV